MAAQGDAAKTDPVGAAGDAGARGFGLAHALGAALSGVPMLLGMAALGLGGWLWAMGGDVPRQLGDVWFDWHKESLIGLQSGLENRISPEAFLAVEPALYQPAWAVLAGLGGVLILLSMLISAVRLARRG